jgi:hypothetical protein
MSGRFGYATTKAIAPPTKQANNKANTANAKPKHQRKKRRKKVSGSLAADLDESRELSRSIDIKISLPERQMPCHIDNNCP